MAKFHHHTLCAVAVAALLQACSSGGDRNSATPVSQAPSISGLSAITLDQDTTSGKQTFRIDDADTPSAQLELTVSSSDPSLLPLRGILIEGSDKERTLRVIPAAEATGSATLTLTVRDPSGLTASTPVDVRVNPVFVEFGSLAQSAFGAADNAAAARVSGVTVQSSVDEDPRAFDALLQQGAQ